MRRWLAWITLALLLAAPAHAQGPEESSPSPIEAAPIEAAPIEAAPIEASPVEAAPIEAAPVEVEREPSRVDLRLAQGEALFEAGNYDAALAEFEEAYAGLDGDPERYLLLFNVGQCQERLFRYDQAIVSYQRYLREGGDDDDGAAEVEASIRALDGLLGTMTLTVNVARASVWVDGREVGSAPGEIRIPGGPHTIELRADGRVPSAQQITIAARGHVDLSITLVEVSSFEGMDPIVFALTTSATALVLLAALGTGIAARVMSGDQQGRPVDRRSLADQRVIADTALVADALWLAGGTLLVAAIALAALTDWDGHPAPAHEASARLVPGPGWLMLTGEF